MSKIIVPQELQDKIVDLYVNKGYNRPRIKRELGLSFGDSVIRRILVENNIEIRTNPGALKGGRKKQEVSREIQDAVIEAYAKGYGLDKIVRELELPFSFDKVRTILQDNEIHIRNIKEAQQVSEKPDLRKYSINDNYNFISHNGAWLLGFLAADGYLPSAKGARNRIVIALARKDEEMLEIIKKELEYEGPVYQYDSHGFPTSALSFSSRPIREKVESYGIVNAKTFKLKHLPDLPDEYMIDFIRGFFDGDGSVYRTKGKPVATSICCAKEDFLQEMSTYISQKCNIAKNKVYKNLRCNGESVIYTINYGIRDSIKLCEAMYNNNYIALPRKKQRYFDYKRDYYNSKRKSTPTSLERPEVEGRKDMPN